MYRRLANAHVSFPFVRTDSRRSMKRAKSGPRVYFGRSRITLNANRGRSKRENYVVEEILDIALTRNVDPHALRDDSPTGDWTCSFHFAVIIYAVLCPSDVVVQVKIASLDSPVASGDSGFCYLRVLPPTVVVDCSSQNLVYRPASEVCGRGEQVLRPKVLTTGVLPR